jgi:O-antigen/teichoic acid export membrane protein
LIKIIQLKNRLIANKLILDSFWVIIGNAFLKGLALVSGVLVARFLGKDVYGEYVIIKVTLMSVAVFSTLGLGYTATKYVAEYKESNPDYIPLILKYSRNITIVLSTIMAIMLFSFAPYISSIMLEAPHLLTPLRLVSTWLIFSAVTTTQIGVLAGFGAFKDMAKINAILGVVTFLLTVIFTYLFSLTGALFALLLIQVLNCFLNYRLTDRLLVDYKNTKVYKDKVFLKEMLIFSFPISLQEGFYALTSWLISMILIKYSNYGEFGMYSAALQWSMIILFIPAIMRNVILSHLAQYVNNADKFDRTLKLTIFINLITTLIPVLIIFMFSDTIALIYGENYNGLGTLINIAVFSTIFISISNVLSQVYMSKGLNWIMLSFRLVRDFGIIGLFFIIDGYGFLESAAQSLLFSILFLNVLFMIIMWVYYKWKLK